MDDGELKDLARAIFLERIARFGGAFEPQHLARSSIEAARDFLDEFNARIQPDVTTKTET